MREAVLVRHSYQLDTADYLKTLILFKSGGYGKFEQSDIQQIQNLMNLYKNNILLKDVIQASKKTLEEEMKIFKRTLSKKELKFKVGSPVNPGKEFIGLDPKTMMEVLNNGR